MATRKSGYKRKALPEKVRLEVWGRSGGRCAICNRYLLDGALAYNAIRLGELAHIVGQQNTAGSPRGQNDLVERDTADNVMLVCADEHDEIDAPENLDVFTIEKLLAFKHAHEDRIKHVTGIAPDRTTTVLRMIGQIRGHEVELTRQTASSAVLIAGDRIPLFLDSYSRHGIEIELRHVLGEATIDLRDVPGEDGTNGDYYGQAKAVIDNVIDNKLNEGIARDQVAHLSVFGFARIPLLVYLGSRLDDTVPTDIYQRHRHDETWTWSEYEPAVAFATYFDQDMPPTEEAVLVLNLSGSIQTAELPSDLAGLRRYRISPVEATPAPDIMRHRGSLAGFQERLRALFADIEANAKCVRRLHVLPAVPLSAAVSLGRVHDRQVHPRLTIYDRTDRGYRPALEIK